ncbi:retrotransposon protein, putative, Ty3-gypsy subclass [Panicum miliaceum]|uniref:Retrotransposon protein, putative, Ty3-gypsy subclass n=1 Tax=Panicum miliaceum TaxID=4540 RepID=A0A3L6QHG1_PANMI|nr:retrotransposon protein, putative, Ty3-gypsy subclass [Panicum miliaceum]
MNDPAEPRRYRASKSASRPRPWRIAQLCDPEAVAGGRCIGMGRAVAASGQRWRRRMCRCRCRGLPMGRVTAPLAGAAHVTDPRPPLLLGRAFTRGTEGKPLSPIAEEGDGSTELLEYSHTADNSPDRQVYMTSLHNADNDEPGHEYDNELLADVSANEPTADAPQDENQEHRRIRRLKNAKRAQRRRNMENHARNPMYQRNLNNAFAVAVDREYRTPIGAIAEAALLAQQLPPYPQIQRLLYLTQRSLVLLDGQHPVSSTRNMPSRQKINDGRDARCIIEARRRDHPDRYPDDDNNDRFPAFTSNITEISHPKDFKPVRIPKYDGKQDLRQRIRCYSVAMEVSGGSNSTKELYFLVALESAPLTWLESLKPNSIDPWENLKRAFIDNF